MFSLFFPLPSRRDKYSRKLLVEELQKRISPQLLQLNFVPYLNKTERHGGFVTNYFRKLPDQIDVINFQWRKDGTPQFIINFDVIRGLKKIASKSKSGSETWFAAPPFRASARKGMVERWYKIGNFESLFSPNFAARKEVEKARLRILEIDEYARTGEISGYFLGL